MTDAERARAYRKKRSKRISRSSKERRNEAQRQALQIAAGIQRNTREAEMAAAADRASAQLAKADRVFPFILADPRTIWLGGQGRVTPYGSMTIEAICAIHVPAADDAVLWLWSTRPLLIKAPHKIIPAWGFEDSTNWAWEKTDQDGEELENGTGRDQNEILIHCTRESSLRPGASSRAASSRHRARGCRTPTGRGPAASRCSFT